MPKTALKQALPSSLHDVVEAIGQAAALKLVAAYGGVRLYIPERLAHDHHLVRVIGHAAARRLSRVARLSQIWIPKCSAALRAARNEEIVSRWRDGEKPDDLAREYVLTDRHVWRIIAGYHNDRQPDMFE